MVQMLERSMVRERTRAGLIAARDRGVKVGRLAKLGHHQQQEIIHTVRDGSKTAADAGRLLCCMARASTLAGARGRTISPGKTFLLAQELERIGCRLGWFRVKGFPE